MAKLSKEELLEKVRNYVGDRTDDESIEIVEDINDSFDTSGADEWKRKYEENDKMWRDKYISRFFEKEEEETHETPTEHVEEEKEYNTFDDLFEEED